MGSSGDIGVLGSVIEAVGSFDCDIVVSTAGRKIPRNVQTRSTRIFDYLPGDQVCSQASLVVCNGGSPTTNQALAHGVPVLGIASNMDQFMNMRSVEAFGAGILLRGDRVKPEPLARAIASLLNDPVPASRAKRLGASPSLAQPGHWLEGVIVRPRMKAQFANLARN
jgi:UDP:flavonoid glycosyltransferase YjiC (YdhE family)